MPNYKAAAYAKFMFKSGYSEQYIDADMLSKHYSVNETKEAIAHAKNEIRPVVIDLTVPTEDEIKQLIIDEQTRRKPIINWWNELPITTKITYCDENDINLDFIKYSDINKIYNQF